MTSPHVGDIGTPFTITVHKTDGISILDVSSTTARNIIFTKPNGIKLVKSADLATDGTDGKILYKIQSGDIDVSGTWKIRGQVTFVNGNWFTDELSFTVLD